jgi:hypothetical protein
MDQVFFGNDFLVFFQVHLSSGSIIDTSKTHEGISVVDFDLLRCDMQYAKAYVKFYM